MANFEKLAENLKKFGYDVSVFPTAAAAAAYLDGELLSQAKELLEGQKIQIGSCTLELAAFCKGERRWEK